MRSTGGADVCWAIHTRQAWDAPYQMQAPTGLLAAARAVGPPRTPASSSLEYARLKLEAAAALARSIPETQATNSNINPGGGRIYIDIGKSTQRKRSAQQIGAELRARTSLLVGAEFTVLDDLNNGAAKPVQIQFTGTDSRKLLEITNDFMARLRKVPGAVDVGLSQQDPQNELRIELDRGLANSLGISAADATNALRVQHRAEINAQINDALRSHPRAHWIDVLNAAGVPAGTVQTLAGAYADPQVQHQQMVMDVEHPGHGTVKMLGFPIKFTQSPCEVRLPAPDLGADTQAVLRELGYDDEQIRQLNTSQETTS